MSLVEYEYEYAGHLLHLKCRRLFSLIFWWIRGKRFEFSNKRAPFLFQNLFCFDVFLCTFRHNWCWHRYFVNIWNEFLTNYLLVGSSKQNLRSVMVAVYDLTGNNLINYQVLAAACVLVMMPVIILFLATRKVFFSAMVEGAVKG